MVLLLGVAAVLALGSGLIAVTLSGLRSDLTAMRAELDAGLDAASGGDIEGAAARFAQAVELGDSAVGRAHSPPVQLVGSLPGARSTVKSAVAVTDAAHLVARAGDRMLTALLDVPGGMDALTLGAGGEDGWLTALASLDQPVADVQAFLELADQLVEHAPAQTRVRQVDDARAELAARLDEVLPVLERSRGLVTALPELLGSEGRRRYFLGAQNPAELRGTGGVIGAYAILTANGGQISITPFRPVQDLEQGIFTIDHAPSQEFFERYGQFSRTTGTWLNINFSPDFPSVAQTIERLYEASEGVRLDGVVVVDPFALEAMLRVTGPVLAADPDVGELTADTVVEFVVNEAPAIFEARGGIGAERKEVLGEAARSVLQTFLGGSVAGEDRVAALAEAAQGGHILVHSVDPAVQEALVAAGVDGGLPSADGVSLSVIGTNLAESKADFYVDRAVDWTLNLDPDGSATAEVEVTLTNHAPGRGLPRYVLGPGPVNYPGVPLGTNFTLVSLYCGECQVLSSHYADDQEFGQWIDGEVGHSVVSTIERLDRDEVQTVRHLLEIPFAWQRAGSEGSLNAEFFTQPTIRGTALTVTVNPPAGWELAPRDTNFEERQDSLVWSSNSDYSELFSIDLEFVGS